MKPMTTMNPTKLERLSILRAVHRGLLPLLPAAQREVHVAVLDAEEAADEAAAARALAAAAERAAVHAGRVARLLDGADTTRPR
jgi:hypothetical protein